MITLTAHLATGAGVVDGSVTPAKTTITGTPDGTKYLRDDWSWQVPTAAAADTNPSLHVTTANYELLANRSLVFAGEYEIGDTFTTDIASGGILEI